jgi:DNA-binding transcriptional LysR family regulator
MIPKIRIVTMTRTNFDLDVLRSFVTGVELGSFAQAADRLGRSTSAVSAQLRKLEAQAGAAVFRKAGRGLALTEAGETMLAYARRLIDLNDEAAGAMRGADLEGWVRLGMPEDFGEAVLPDVLGRFSRAHPKVRIEARVARNAELLGQAAENRLDLALVWNDGSSATRGETVSDVQLRWIGPTAAHHIWQAGSGEPLPLVVFEAPCIVRSAATAALDRAGIPWRVVFTSPSLGGLWAAVSAGLGYTVRTGIGLPAGLRALGAGEGGLPKLPSLALSLCRGDLDHGSPADLLAGIVLEEVRNATAALPQAA